MFKYILYTSSSFPKQTIISSSVCAIHMYKYSKGHRSLINSQIINDNRVFKCIIQNNITIAESDLSLTIQICPDYVKPSVYIQNKPSLLPDLKCRHTQVIFNIRGTFSPQGSGLLCGSIQYYQIPSNSHMTADLSFFVPYLFEKYRRV